MGGLTVWGEKKREKSSHLRVDTYNPFSFGRLCCVSVHPVRPSVECWWFFSLSLAFYDSPFPLWLKRPATATAGAGAAALLLLRGVCWLRMTVTLPYVGGTTDRLAFPPYVQESPAELLLKEWVFSLRKRKRERTSFAILHQGSSVWLARPYPTRALMKSLLTTKLLHKKRARDNKLKMQLHKEHGKEKNDREAFSKQDFFIIACNSRARQRARRRRRSRAGVASAIDAKLRRSSSLSQSSADGDSTATPLVQNKKKTLFFFSSG